MEALAFVEVLGRHGEVQARHAVYRWPARVGRGYDAEIILDDPFVAPRHASIEPAGDGRFKVSDLQSVNGLSVSPSSRRVPEAEVGPEDVVRLGRTQIRVRAPSYAVLPEQRMRAVALHRRPGSFVAAAGVLLALTLWSAWVMTSARDEWATLLFPALVIAAVAGVWISVWALVSRTVGGRANFAAHGFVACAGLAAIELADTLFDYLSFGFDARWLEHGGTAVLAALAGAMLYRHLRLNSRATRRQLGFIAALIVAAGFGVGAGVERAAETRREGMQGYDNTLKSPAFLWVAGEPPGAFLAAADALQRAADAAAGADN